jgi:hypothetical protein
MNQTGCPAGLATDQFLMHEQDPGRCDANLAVFAALAATSLSVQLIIAVGQAHLWLRRERRRKEPVNSKERMVCGRRLPIVPVLAWVVLVSLLLVYLLVGLNIANTGNGGGTFFMGLILCLYGIINILLLVKFVSLGYNIIMPSVSNKRAASLYVNKERQDQLKRFDIKGRINLTIGLLPFIAMVVLCCIVGLIIPNK